MHSKLLALALLTLSAGSTHGQGTVELVSRNSDGDPADRGSSGAAISADANVVAFGSSAQNLSPDPIDLEVGAVFVRDRAAGTCELVTVTVDGSAANDWNGNPSVSHDGRYVLFWAMASNLVANDANGGAADLFLRDRVAGTTVVASLTSEGLQSDYFIQEGSISADGAWIVFETNAPDIVPNDTNGESDVFVRNLSTGAVERVSRRSDGSQALDASMEGSLNWDGSRVAFTSYDRLVPQDTNNSSDVYVLHRTTGALELVSVGSSPANAESHWTVLSTDGSTVAFYSWASNLVPGDTNGWSDIFWRDLASGEIGIATVRSTGEQLPGGGDFPGYPTISGNGRFIAFGSKLEVVPGIPGGYHVYVHDRVAGATRLIDAASDGLPADLESSMHAQFSWDGRWVAFSSTASNLASDDGPEFDVFVRDLASAPPARYCSGKLNSEGCIPRIEWAGTPSATSGEPFMLSATNVIRGQIGLLFYGLTPQNVPFQGGRRCVARPIVRTAQQMATNAIGACSGRLAFDFNAHIRLQTDADMVSGSVVHAQFWYRDPADPAGFGSGLTDAVAFAIQP